MIWIDASEHSIHLSITGHAQAGPYGADIVCAAVTGLIRTLKDALEALSEGGLAGEVTAVLKPGRGTIACREPGVDAWAVYTAICQGLYTLSKEYPRNVAFTRDWESFTRKDGRR